jgi:DNA-binding transcriptional LysR family regulator
LALTTPGEILLNYARQIIKLNDEIGEELGLGRTSEVVHIGMPEHFSESLLPVLIAEAHHRFPHIQLVVKIARSQILADGLTEGRLNMALLLGPQPSEDRAPHQPVPLQWIRSSACSFDLDLTSDPVPLVLFRSPCGFRNIATQVLENAGLRWRCVHEGEDLATLRAAVLANIGITALPIVRDYAGLATIDRTSSLPELPNVTLRLRRHPQWRSKASDGLFDLVGRVWDDFNVRTAQSGS